MNALRAASRALRERREERDDAAVVAVDSAITSVGIVGGRSGEVLEDDPVHAIPGREAREVAVSLRCLLKQRSRAQARSLLRKVTVVGESSEVERVGRRSFERELEGLGALEVEFELDPFLLAQGALLLAKDAESQVWRRIRRQWR